MDETDRDIVLTLIEKERSAYELAKRLFHTDDQWELRKKGTFLRYRLQRLVDLGLVRADRGLYWIRLEDIQLGKGTMFIKTVGKGEVQVEVGRVLVVTKQSGEQDCIFLDIADPDNSQRWVYFIKAEFKDGPMVKIGTAQSPLRRARTLQTGLGCRVEILGGFKEPGESEIHKRFAADRVRGEWFKLTPELENYVKEKNELSPKEMSLPSRAQIREKRIFGTSYIQSRQIETR